jgi:hypothetical protein
MPRRGRRDLHDRALGSDVAAEHTQATLRAERSINRPDDLLSLIRRWPRLAFEFLAKAAAGDRDGGPVDEPSAEKLAEQGRHAAGLVQFGRGEPATRLEVAEQRGPSRDRVDVG